MKLTKRRWEKEAQNNTAEVKKKNETPSPPPKTGKSVPVAEVVNYWEIHPTIP